MQIKAFFLPVIYTSTHCVSKVYRIKIKKNFEHIYNVFLYCKYGDLPPLPVFNIFLMFSMKA
jgi:hypothetical protein